MRSANFRLVSASFSEVDEALMSLARSVAVLILPRAAEMIASSLILYFLTFEWRRRVYEVASQHALLCFDYINNVFLQSRHIFLNSIPN